MSIPTHEKQSYYSTSDINLCATLSCYGNNCEFIEKEAGNRRAVFFIQRSKRLDELIQKYFTGQLLVEPIRFANSIKNIKTRLYHS